MVPVNECYYICKNERKLIRNLCFRKSGIIIIEKFLWRLFLLS